MGLWSEARTKILKVGSAPLNARSIPIHHDPSADPSVKMHKSWAPVGISAALNARSILIHYDPSAHPSLKMHKSWAPVGIYSNPERTIHPDPSTDPSVKMHKSWAPVRIRKNTLSADPSRSISRSISKCTSRGRQCDFEVSPVLYLKF